MASRIPELPHNKLYHIFVCYEKNSLDVVRCIVDNLEQNGIVCCFSDRDFLPGQSIVQNIHDAIRKSLHMLIVLSEEFENSTYCMHEVEEAFTLKISEEYSLIPIKAEPCSVPERLRHLVYIDVEDDIEGAHGKIIDAIAKKDLRGGSKKDRNGESMTFELTPYKPHFLSFKRYKLKFTDKEKVAIWRKNFEIPVELLEDIEDTVNGSLFVKYLHSWMNVNLTVLIAFLLLLIVVLIVFLILFIITSGREKTDSFQPAAYTLAIGLPLWFLAVIVSECLYSSLLAKLKGKVCDMLKAKLWNISRRNNNQTRVLFNLCDTFTEPCVRLFIMYYNFKRCKVYFARHLEEREALKKYRMENETNEECTSRLFDIYLRYQCSELLTFSARSERHEMRNRAKCVCLLVEDWLKRYS